MPRSLIKLCALALCLLASASARAAFWLVPAGAPSPATIATVLTRAGVSGDLVRVMAGLNAAFPIRNKPRMVDLQSGLVRELDASVLQGVSFVQNGEVQTLAELLALPSVVIVLDAEADAGPTLQVLSNDGTGQSHVLEPDERALLGESPCGEGYAPISYASGTRCEDIDECEAGLDDCDAHASCDNERGGFECTCDDGYEGDGRDCEEEESVSSGGSSGGGDEEPPDAAGGDGGPSAPDAGVGTDDGGVDVEDAGRSEGPGGRPDAGGRPSESNPHAGGDAGCDCHVTRFEPSSLAHPLLVPLLWLLHRRRRALSLP